MAVTLIQDICLKTEMTMIGFSEMRLDGSISQELFYNIKYSKTLKSIDLSNNPLNDTSAHVMSTLTG
jgi:hypothetical protein